MYRAASAMLLATLLAVAAAPAAAQKGPEPGAGQVAASELPAEAKETLARIGSGGPHPYAKDGTVFGNREGRLPRQKRGYYREYTVKTPGVRNRGARRIVAGRPGEYWYTDDHYATFRRIRE